MLDHGALKLFAVAGSATVYEAAGRTSDLDPDIRTVVPGLAVAGPAFCVHCEPGDNLAIHRAMAEVGLGAILVIAGHGERCGYIGDILAEAARARGCIGVVIDGSVRDAAELRKMGFPVWARGFAIRSARKTEPGRIGEPIACGGVRVTPGDLIVADDDGVCAVPAAHLPALSKTVSERLQQEAEMRTRLKGGELTLDLLHLRRYLPA